MSIRKSGADDDSAPLHGVKVLEFGHIAAGPYAGLLLAELGADVVKVEPPSGDGLRTWPPFARFGDDLLGYNFMELNRNKRSVRLDLKKEADLALAMELAATSDVLLENYRPGTLDRLGLGFEVLAQVNRRLVYCSISGYGSSGPQHKQGAFDVVIQAETGLMDITGEPDGGPVKAGIPVADFAAGQYAALSVVAALRSDRQNATKLDCSMLESVLSFGSMQVSQYWGTGMTPSRLGTAHPRNAPYQGFPTRSGMVVVAAGNDKLFAAMCGVLSLHDLTRDPRYKTLGNRVENQSSLENDLAPVVREWDPDELVLALQGAGVPSAKVKSIAEAIDSDQLEHREFFGEAHYGPDNLPMQRMRFPVHFNGENEFNNWPAPLLGEHTDVVANEWLAPSGNQPAIRAL